MDDRRYPNPTDPSMQLQEYPDTADLMSFVRAVAAGQRRVETPQQLSGVLAMLKQGDRAAGSHSVPYSDVVAPQEDSGDMKANILKALQERFGLPEQWIGSPEGLSNRMGRPPGMPPHYNKIRW